MVRKIDHEIAKFRLRIGRSRIHRWGVFAEEEIPANKQVIEYTGKHITRDFAEKLPPRREAYVAILSGRWYADPIVGGSGAEFINHSCKPNLKSRRTRGRLFLYSRRKIKAGEELTGDYNYLLKLKQIPCRCGAKGCRGTFRYLLRR